MAMGPSGVGSALPRFDFLDRLASDSTSAYVVEEKNKKGHQTLEAYTTGWMEFKSGINRVFHFKSDSDKATNQATLQHLLRDIEQSSSSRVASDVRNSDVFDRALKRGTYVSSELIGKLRDIANDAAKKELDDKNFTTFRNFLDRGREIDVGHDHVKFTEVPSNGLTDLVDDLASGTRPSHNDKWPADQFPKTYALMKQVVHDATAESRVGQMARLHVMDQEIDHEGNFVYGPDHPIMQGLKQVQSPVMQQLAAYLHQTADKATELGVRVTDEMLAKTATQYLTSNPVMTSLVKEVNTNRLNELVDDPAKVSDLVRQLEDDADQGKLGNIRKEDVTWLADALAQDKDVDMPIPKLRGRRSDREAQWPIEVIRPEGLAKLLVKTVVQGSVPPPKSAMEGLDVHGLREFTDKTLKFSHHELTDGELSSQLLRNESDGKPSILLQVLQQRRAGLDAIDKHDAMVRDQREKLVGSKVAQFNDLPSVPLGRSKAEELHVEDVRGFVKAVALDPIGQAKRVQLENDGVTDAQDLNRQSLAERQKWEDRLDKLMPALDRFADMGRRLDDIASKGGLKSLDRTMWKNIQDEARSLMEAVPQIKQLAADLDKEYGDVVVLQQLAAALESAAEQIEADITAGGLTKLHDVLASSTNDRMFGQLPPLRVLQQEQFAREVPEMDDFLAGIKADIDAMLDDLELPVGEDAEKVEAPENRPTQPATGKTPGETVLNAMGAAFSDATRDELLPDGAGEAFGKWVSTSGRFLDRYAEFAVRHEDVAQLRRLGAEERTDDESLRVTKFLQETVTMRDEVDKFAASTNELRKAVGTPPPPELARLLDSLDASVEHMRSALSQASFVRTSRESPYATAEDRLIHVDDKFLARTTNLLVSLSLGDKGPIENDGVDSMSAMSQLRTFDRGVKALMFQSPVARSDEDRDALGALDLRAERLLKRAEGMSNLLERIDKTRAEVENGTALLPIGGPLGSDSESVKTNALKRLDEAHDSIRLQLQTLRTTVADYQFYRGEPDPTARYASALRTMSQALTAGGAPSDGWATFGNNVFAGLIDSHINEHGMDALSHQMKPGLAAIDKLGAFRAGVKATLGDDRQPTESQLATLRDGLKEMEQARDELVSLRDHAKVMERALTKGETFEEFMTHAPMETFLGLPGVQPWQQFETVLTRALDEMDRVMETARTGIEKADPRPTPPLTTSISRLDQDVDATVDERLTKIEVGPETNPFAPGWVAPKSNNPFDDDAPPVLNTVPPKSTNPFDNLPPQTTTTVPPRSTNPFDNLPPQTTTTTTVPPRSTNPFDTD